MGQLFLVADRDQERLLPRGGALRTAVDGHLDRLARAESSRGERS
jgi:hypothetical protein